jgi:hypothetical protein
MENNINNVQPANNNGYKKSLSIIIIIALVIIINLIYTYGLRLFFAPQPFSTNSLTEMQKEQEVCRSLYDYNQIYTKEACLFKEGVWTEYTDNNQYQYTNQGGQEVKITGSCNLYNQSQACYTKVSEKYGEDYRGYYSNDNPKYMMTNFIVGVAIAIILIICSILIPANLSIIATSLAFSGIVILIRSTFSYWNYFSDILRFGILVLAFIALVFFVIKKLKR